MIWKIFLPLLSFAFIPKATTILQKTVDNDGSGIYTIEQEVQFPSAQEPLVLKETWIIENDNKMRLSVRGTHELKDKLHWVFLYENGNRYLLQGGVKSVKRIDDDFIEKYFHFRKPETFANALVRMKVAPASLFAKKPLTHLGHEPDVQSDPYLRLARVGGGIAYAFGLPAEKVPGQQQEPLPPAFFIEQDQFVLRKFRLPSQVEVSADRYSVFARGLNFPRTRVVKWIGHDRSVDQVTLQTIHVQPRFEKTLSLNLEDSTRPESTDLGAARPLVMEFYQRFR